jgi:hypothetical protein
MNPWSTADGAPFDSSATQLVHAPTSFVRFTFMNTANPGGFYWGQPVTLTPAAPHYPGKVVVLVDEISQSQAGYTTMAFRASPRWRRFRDPSSWRTEFSRQWARRLLSKRRPNPTHRYRPRYRSQAHDRRHPRRTRRIAGSRHPPNHRRVAGGGPPGWLLSGLPMQPHPVRAGIQILQGVDEEFPEEFEPPPSRDGATPRRCPKPEKIAGGDFPLPALSERKKQTA